MSRTREQQQLKRQASRLYERYAKPLEAEHNEEYIAISPKVEVILGETMLGVAQKATDTFGRGNFVFRLGPRVVGRWR